MKKFFHEFKEFINKGNVFQLAIGVIIGASCQTLVKSFTDNILSPIIGIFANQNFDTLSVEFFGVTLHYGLFITAVINFLITLFVIFLMIKLITKVVISPFQKDEEPTTKECPYCCSEISIKANRCPNCTTVLEEE